MTLSYLFVNLLEYLYEIILCRIRNIRDLYDSRWCHTRNIINACISYLQKWCWFKRRRKHMWYNHSAHYISGKNDALPECIYRNRNVLGSGYIQFYLVGSGRACFTAVHEYLKCR